MQNSLVWRQPHVVCPLSKAPSVVRRLGSTPKKRYPAAESGKEETSAQSEAGKNAPERAIGGRKGRWKEEDLKRMQ